ncbi:MAG: ribosome-associated translation inhibitor RaiA [Pseudomonadota bacterium]
MISELETTFTFRNMDSTDALRDHTFDKLTRLDKYLIQPASAHVIFNIDGANQVAEITLNVKGGRYVGTAHSNDMYTSIDSAVDKIKNQMSRTKERRKGHKGE